MPAVYEPRHWPFGVPYMAALTAGDLDALSTAWCQVLKDAPAGKSMQAGGRSVGGVETSAGAAARDHDEDSSNGGAPAAATSLYASHPEQLRAIFTRVRLPLAPLLSAAAGTAAHRQCDAWLEAVLQSRATFTGEHQTPAKLMFDEAVQIVMRLRSAVVLHAHGLRVPDVVQAEIVDECGVRLPPQPTSGLHHDHDHNDAKPHPNQRAGPGGGGRLSLSLRHGARRLSLMPGARHNRTNSHRQRSGSDSTNAGGGASGCLPHPVHDIAARPDFWLGPAELLASGSGGGKPQSSQRRTRAALEVFTAAGGAPDGTGTIGLGRVGRCLQGTCVDVAHALGGKLAAVQQQVSPAAGVQRGVDDDGDDYGDAGGGDRATLAELATMLHSGGGDDDDDNDDGAAFDRFRKKSHAEGDGRSGFTPSNSLRPGGGGPDAPTNVGGVPSDGQTRPDYRLTASGKFVLQPWVKRPAYVTNARLERGGGNVGGPSGGGDGGGGSGSGSARPVGGMSRRQRRSSRAVTLAAVAQGTPQQPQQKPRRASKGNTTQATTTTAVAAGATAPGRGLAALRAAMVTSERRGRDVVTLNDVLQVVAADDDDRAHHPGACGGGGGGGSGALASYDADLPALDDPPPEAAGTTIPATDGGLVDEDTSSGARPRDLGASSSSDDDESDTEVAARYRTLQLPHIYGSSSGSGPKGLPQPLPKRAATSLEVRGKYSTAAVNTRRVDPNRAAALERARRMQLDAEAQAEAMDRDRRRRMAAGLGGGGDGEDGGGDASPAGERRRAAAAPAVVVLQPGKRRASNEGTLRIAARLLANFEASPSRRAVANTTTTTRRPPVHMTNAAFRAASAEQDPFGGVDNGSFVSVHQIGRSQRGPRRS